MVHNLYAELVRWGCELNVLYDYSVKELLFILKYKREGLAESWWLQGLANRAAYHAKVYASKPEELYQHMYEKTQSSTSVPIPDWLREDYEKKINASVKRSN